MISRKIIMLNHNPITGEIIEHSFGNSPDILYVYYNDKTYKYYTLCMKNNNNNISKTNVHFSDHMRSDTEVKNAFYKTLKSGNYHEILKKVRIISYFSKVVEKDFMKRNPICFLESYAVFQALSTFEKRFDITLCVCFL